MRIAMLLSKLFGRDDLENDLRTEVEFHIRMRMQSYLKDGKAPEEADALARRQFGDVEEVMNGMRYARLRSTTAAVATTSAVVIVAGLLLYSASSPGAAIVFPPLPGVPIQTSERRLPPPPPPPPPTWEEFVAKVNTFGHSGDSKSRRR